MSKRRNLRFEGVPDADIAVYSTGVLDTLSILGVDWDYDETSPPDANGECTFIVQNASGPITEDTHATTQTPAPVATDRGAEGSETV